MKAVSAILLAAGESRRMGEVNKLGLLVDGTPLLRRTANILLASGLQEVVVVVGHEAEVVNALLGGLPVRVVLNKDYRDGQMSSVHTGLKALCRRCDGVMICLGDQPRLATSDINRLIEAFSHCEQSSVLVPMYQGERGNPIILDCPHRETILGAQQNFGCKHLIKNNPELVSTIEMDSDHVLTDLDTPEDYQRFLTASRVSESRGGDLNSVVSES